MDSAVFVRLTGLGGVVDPPQQGPALLLGPVVDDPGQDVQISSREFVSEEISCVGEG